MGEEGAHPPPQTARSPPPPTPQNAPPSIDDFVDHMRQRQAMAED